MCLFAWTKLLCMVCQDYFDSMCWLADKIFGLDYLVWQFGLVSWDWVVFFVSFGNEWLVLMELFLGNGFVVAKI